MKATSKARTSFKAASRLAMVAAALAMIGSMSTVSSEDFGPAKVAYDDYIKRPSLQMRTRGRIKLASSGHKGAFDILSASYAKAEEPKDQVKYLIASICARYLGQEEFMGGWEAWRNKHTAPEDAWLWHRELLLRHDFFGDDPVLKVASEQKSLFLRAAALEALAHNGSDGVLAWWETKLDEAENWKDIERAVMLETAAHCLETEAHQLGQDQFRKTALKLIPLIEHKLTHDRTKLVMARYFKNIFGGDHLFINADPWLNKLLNPNVEQPRDSKYAPAAPPTKFVGIETSGKRIVYVIDCSDSMLAPVSAREKEEIKKPPEPKGPVTGRGETGGKRDPGIDGKGAKGNEKEEEEEEEEKGLEDELPWDKIKTRFDVAREYLKLSLKSLQPSQEFCVITFGTVADTLKSTKGLMKADKANVDKAIAELTRMKAGPATDMRKYGTLLGDTNLHGGIHRAFKVKRGGMVKMFEYVEPSTFFDGADTIFILSDGDPTDDDWAINDKRDPFDQTGDPESRTKMPDQDVLRFPGPYGYMYQGEYLPDDVRRLNLFRKCEIHCIGIGEVSMSLMQSIAKWGDGQVKYVGSGVANEGK